MRQGGLSLVLLLCFAAILRGAEVSQPLIGANFVHQHYDCIESLSQFMRSLSSEAHQLNLTSALYPLADLQQSQYIEVTFHHADGPSGWVWSVSEVLARTPHWRLALLSLGALWSFRQSTLELTLPAFCPNVSLSKRADIAFHAVPMLQRRTHQGLGVPFSQTAWLEPFHCVAPASHPSSAVVDYVLWLCGIGKTERSFSSGFFDLSIVHVMTLLLTFCCAFVVRSVSRSSFAGVKSTDDTYIVLGFITLINAIGYQPLQLGITVLFISQRSRLAAVGQAVLQLCKLFFDDWLMDRMPYPVLCVAISRLIGILWTLRLYHHAWTTGSGRTMTSVVAASTAYQFSWVLVGLILDVKWGVVVLVLWGGMIAMAVQTTRFARYRHLNKKRRQSVVIALVVAYAALAFSVVYAARAVIRASIGIALGNSFIAATIAAGPKLFRIVGKVAEDDFKEVTGGMRSVFESVPPQPVSPVDESIDKEAHSADKGPQKRVAAITAAPVATGLLKSASSLTISIPRKHRSRSPNK